MPTNGTAVLWTCIHRAARPAMPPRARAATSLTISLWLCPNFGDLFWGPASNVAYCLLLSGEKEGCFTWVLRILDEAEPISLPQMIVSDFDKAFKKACRQHQLCLWHIMNKVAFNVKKKWVGTLDGTSLAISPDELAQGFSAAKSKRWAAVIILIILGEENGDIGAEVYSRYVVVISNFGTEDD
ncbi:hypothetical protein OQA88_9466 [Cercophora sp. LCS_1]